MDLDRIADLCQRLALGQMAHHVSDLAEEAARNKRSYTAFLERLLDAEHRER